MLGFEGVAEKQYTRNLLFSTLFDLMIQVVLPQQTSMHAAYRAQVQNMEVSVTSVYNKLNTLEVTTAGELVGYAAEQAETLIEELNGARAPLLLGVGGSRCWMAIAWQGASTGSKRPGRAWLPPIPRPFKPAVNLSP